MDVPKDAVYRFMLIFLVILMAMNMFYFLLDHVSETVFLDPYLFRTTMFIMLLSIMMIMEILLFMLLKRYTLLGVLMLCLLVGGILVPSGDGASGKSFLFKLIAPFLANKYVRLRSTDILMLLTLNSIILAFLVTILVKQPDSTDHQNEKKS